MNTSQNELVHIGQPPPSALAVPMSEGIDDMFTLKPQNMELVQATSRAEGVTPGMFRSVQTNEHFAQIEIVILKAGRGRVEFPPGDFGGEVICRSSDGLVPSPFVQNPPSLKCGTYVNGRFKAICKHAEWGPNRKPPACSATLSLLVAEKTTQIPYYMSFKRTSLPPIETLMQALAAKFQAARANGEVPNIYDYAITLKASKVSNATSVYFVPTVLGIKKLTPEDAQEFGGLYQLYVVQQKANAEEAQAEINTAREMQPPAQSATTEPGVVIEA